MPAKGSAVPALDASMRVVVLHGKDAYLLTELGRKYTQALGERFGEVETFRLDGAVATLAQVLDELRSYGMLQRHKLVVVDNADAFLRAEDRRRALERYAEEPMQEASLLLRAEAWRPGNLDKIVQRGGGAIVKCEPPSDERAEEFCERRSAKHYGIPIDRDAAELLVERLGADLARLDSELGKLAALVCDRPEPRIRRPDVAEMVGAGREEAAWEIQSVVLAGKPAAVLMKLRDLLDVSQAPEQLVVWSLVELARKIHDASRLLAQGEPEFAVGKALRLWGPQQAQVLRAARRISPPRAARLFERSLGLDLNVRRGVTRNLPRALQGFAVELADSIGR